MKFADLAITPEVVAGFTDKDSKVARFRSLYEEHDFLIAYSRHTDLRMADNPKGAIGRSDEWESHGKLQLNFLIAQGMKPHHRLLDVGCGPGRAARRFAPYLDAGNYAGADISPACLQHAMELASAEGWAAKRPVFMLNGDLDLLPIGSEGWARFDFIWAHSVFTHLPDSQIDVMIANAARLLPVGGRFLFTYKEALRPTRSGLKQFQFPSTFFATRAAAHHLKCEMLATIWPAHQRTIRLTKRAA